MSRKQVEQARSLLSHLQVLSTLLESETRSFGDNTDLEALKILLKEIRSTAKDLSSKSIQLIGLRNQLSEEQVCQAIIRTIDKTVKPEDLWKLLQHLKTELRAEGFEVQ